MVCIKFMMAPDHFFECTPSCTGLPLLFICWKDKSQNSTVHLQHFCRPQLEEGNPKCSLINVLLIHPPFQSHLTHLSLPMAVNAANKR